MRYAAWATLTAAGHAAHPGNTLFRVPHRIDSQHLVPVETIERDGVTMLRLPEHALARIATGSRLTDAGMNTQQALDQMNYCIWCHTQGKDSCRKGLKDRKTGAVPEVAVRRDAGRLSAGREDQRDAHAARAGQRARRVRDHRHRQPDDGGDRPSHLQRLHEGLHLSEAGPGRYSAGRDPRS